jgi:hypothetical protein
MYTNRFDEFVLNAAITAQRHSSSSSDHGYVINLVGLVEGWVLSYRYRHLNEHKVQSN